jgi:16S rRNA processing protein RimM
MASGAGRVCVGIVVGAQGIRGAVRIKSFTAEPEDVAAYGPVEDERGEQRFGLRVVGRAKGVVIAEIAGVADRNAAERLKGQRLYVGRDALPAPEEEEYYHADLLGLDVVLLDGAGFGKVRAVHDFGGGDCLEVEREAGGIVMVPFTRAAIPVVDLASRRLVLDPPAGLLEPARPGEMGEGETDEGDGEGEGETDGQGGESGE